MKEPKKGRSLVREGELAAKETEIAVDEARLGAAAADQQHSQFGRAGCKHQSGSVKLNALPALPSPL